jgi:hypothetical protein
MRAIAVGLGVLTLVVFSQGASQAVGEPIQIVSPSIYANTEADGYMFAATNGRAQQVFMASDFESLPEGRRTITQIAWRSEGTFDSPVAATFENAVIHLSTTAVDPPNLSWTFANNVGEDETEVFRGRLTISSTNVGPPGGPKEFDQFIHFQTPFHYNPSQGNLLLDLKWTEVSSPQSVDYVGSVGPHVQTVHINDPQLPQAAGTSGGPVTQFTFVPEPSTLLLTIIALGVVGGCRKWGES